MAADPKLLFYVTAAMLGALALGVAWALAKTPTRRDLTPAPALPPTKRSVPAKAADDDDA